MKAYFFVASIFLCYASKAQTGIFQDAKGESALKLFGSSVSLSTKDESIRFAAGKYYRTHNSHGDTYDRFQRWAGTLEIKANEGISTFKDEDKYLIDGAIGLYHGWKKASRAAGKDPASELERFISASIGVDRNKLFNMSLPSKDVVYSKGQLVYKFEMGQYGYTGNMLYGLSGSYKQQTNVDDLKTKSVSFVDFVSDDDSILILRQKQAYDVSEFVGDQHVFSLNADAALLLNRSGATAQGSIPPAFLAFHFRYQYLLNESGQFNPGIGFYLGKHGAPKEIVGGFNIQFLDLFNAKDDESNAWDRAAINFVVGFKLSK